MLEKEPLVSFMMILPCYISVFIDSIWASFIQDLLANMKELAKVAAKDLIYNFLLMFLSKKMT